MDYSIEIELSDGGKLITADKANDFVIKYLVRTEEQKMRERVRGLICPHHHNFPDVGSTINDRYLVVLRVRCCCEAFLNIVDTRFHVK